jgi:CRISPR-associated protein Csd1
MLQALYELARLEGLVQDPDYELRPVAWLVRISEEGKLLGIEDTRYIPPEEAKKRNPRRVALSYSVPRERPVTSGDRPFLLFNKAEYVFGIDPEKKRDPGKLAHRFDLFREKVKQCLDETQDKGVLAVHTLLEDISNARQKITLPVECAGNDLFGFVYAPDIDRLVTERELVRAYWKKQRLLPEEKEVKRQQCLVSGRMCSRSDLFPLLKKVPGGTTSGVALVSFNSKAFESYGWSGNENALISRDAAEASATALNRLLDSSCPDPRQPGQSLPRRNVRLSGDTGVCFWSSGSKNSGFCSAFAGLLEANPDEVQEMYQSIWRGKAAEIDDTSGFYALTISGTQGRAIVRDWLESTVAIVSKNLATYFGDLRIVRNTPKPKAKDLPPHFPVRSLLEALAPKGENTDIPAAQITTLVEGALHGTPFPFSLLQRALERGRAEAGRSEWADLVRRDARAALIKAVLNRRKRFFPDTTRYQEVGADMDPNNTSEGYVLGRLLAVLERLQQEAIGDVNASVIDRYFSGASASPKTVFVRLLKNSRHHVGKLRGDAEKGGTVFRLDRLVDEMAQRFDPRRNGFPTHLNLEQQGLFVLGYHQMRKWLWMSREERDIWGKTYPTAPRAYIWNTNK